MKPRRCPVRLSALVAAGAAVASIVTAAPAQAESQTHRDPKGDVALLKSTRATTDTVDIRRSENTFDDAGLTVSTTVESLADRDWSFVWLVKTPQHRYTGFASNNDGFTGGFSEDGEGPGSCEAAASVVGSTVSLTVPLSCLDGAEQVRVASLTFRPKTQRRGYFDAANQRKLTPRAKVVYAPVLRYS